MLNFPSNNCEAFNTGCLEVEWHDCAQTRNNEILSGHPQFWNWAYLPVMRSQLFLPKPLIYVTPWLYKWGHLNRMCYCVLTAVKMHITVLKFILPVFLYWYLNLAIPFQCYLLQLAIHSVSVMTPILAPCNRPIPKHKFPMFTLIIEVAPQMLDVSNQKRPISTLGI